MAASYQDKVLFAILKHASKNTEFYHGKADNLFQISESEKYISENFQLISKKQILTSPFSFCDKNYKGAKVKGSTSGTTGTPLSIPETMAAVLRERAFNNHQLLWAGVVPGERRTWLRGDMIVPFAYKKKSNSCSLST